MVPQKSTTQGEKFFIPVDLKFFSKYQRLFKAWLTWQYPFLKLIIVLNMKMDSETLGLWHNVSKRRELMTNLLLKCYELAVSLQQEMEHLFLWGYGTCVRVLGVLSGCNVPAWPYRGFPQPMTPCLPSSISSPSHKHVQLHYCQVSDPGYGGLTLELLCIRHCNSCSHKP